VASALASIPLAPEETFALLVAMAAALFAWGRLWYRIMAVDPLVARAGAGRTLVASIAAVAAIDLVVLTTLAASDVRSSPLYVAFYLALGLGVAALNLAAFRFVGLRQSDLIERGNPAARTLFLTGTVASALAYAGGNVGDGPGFWVVLVSAALAHAALYALVVLHAAIARTPYRILVDRDRGIAFRFGCLLIAGGLILGRGVAGDWTGIGRLVGDLADVAWVAPVLFMSDAVIGRAFLAREPEGNLLVDRVSGIASLVIAILWVLWLGAPT